MNKIPNDGFDDKSEFIEWVTDNVKTATFSSVSSMWIRCYILQSLRKANQIDIPYNKLSVGYTNFLSLDNMNPVTNDDNGEPILFKYTSDNDKFVVEYDFDDEENDKNIELKDIINNLLDVLTVTEMRIVKRFFGIGFPCPLNRTDIVHMEMLKTSDVKRNINESLEKIKENVNDEQLSKLYKYIM